VIGYEIAILLSARLAVLVTQPNGYVLTRGAV